MRIGLRIKGLRKEKEMTQEQLASRAGITQPSLSDIETGETKDIASETLLRMSLALEVNPFYLYFGKGTRDMGYLLSEPEQQCLTLFQLLSPSNRETLLTVGRALADSQASPGQLPPPLYLPKPPTQ